MRIDRHHIPWLIFVIAATIVAAALFLANFFPSRLPFPIQLPSWFGPTPPVRRTFGGTPLGLIFGSMAFTIFLFASALGIRKKKRLWRIGNVQVWLRAHIWLTIFTIPLVLLHCGFHLGGTHTSWLMGLYAVVMASGFFGLALQQFMPRMMKERLPREVVYEQIPHIRAKLFEAALGVRSELRALERAATQQPQPVPEVAAAASAPAGATVPAASKPVSTAPAEADPSIAVLGEFLDDECLPYLRARRGERHRLGEQKTSDDIFRLLKLNVSDKLRPRVDDLQLWCDDRRLMDLQLKLHHWLHGWLLVHVPTSFALLVFTAWHAWIAVRFLVILP